jgi:hypothetical protein
MPPAKNKRIAKTASPRNSVVGVLLPPPSLTMAMLVPNAKTNMKPAGTATTFTPPPPVSSDTFAMETPAPASRIPPVAPAILRRIVRRTASPCPKAFQNATSRPARASLVTTTARSTPTALDRIARVACVTALLASRTPHALRLALPTPQMCSSEHGEVSRFKPSLMLASMT